MIISVVKVLYKHPIDNTLKSYRYPTAEDKLSLEYREGEITYPIIPDSFLFAFDTVQHAHDFSETQPHTVLYECEAESAENEIHLIPNNPDGWREGLGICMAEWFWRGWHDPNLDYFPRHRLMVIPVGTVLCKWIKPIRRILYTTTYASS